MRERSDEEPGRATRLQIGGFVLVAVGLLLSAGGVWALIAVVVRASSPGEVATIDSIFLTILSMIVLLSGLAQVVLTWPATRNRFPGRAVGGALAGSLGLLLLIPVSFVALLAVPLLMAIGANIVGTGLVVAGRREGAPMGSGHRAEEITTPILTALAVAALGGAIVFGVSATATPWVSGIQQQPANQALAAMTAVALLGFGLLELLVVRHLSNSHSDVWGFLGGSIAIAGGGAAWLAASRPGIEALIAITAGIAVLVVSGTNRLPWSWRA